MPTQLGSPVLSPRNSLRRALLAIALTVAGLFIGPGSARARACRRAPESPQRAVFLKIVDEAVGDVSIALLGEPFSVLPAAPVEPGAEHV